MKTIQELLKLYCVLYTKPKIQNKKSKLNKRKQKIKKKII